jgi:hypothetical protein
MTLTIPFRDRISCTIPEASAATGLSRSKLYQEIAAGRVETSKIGGRTLVLIPSLENLIAVGARLPAPDPAGTAVRRRAGLPDEASSAAA